MCDSTPNHLKRKRTSSTSSSDAEDGDRTPDGIDDQRLRRRVVELSLSKVRTVAPLTRSQRRREPPLLRSVLILNTLRAVDPARVFLDAADPTLCGGAAPLAPSTPYRPPSVLDELPGSLLDAPGPRAADDAAVSAILDDLFGERTVPPLPPVLTFSSLFELDGAAAVWPPPHPVATSPSPAPSSLDPADLDLDATMFDFDLLTPVAAAATCPGSSRPSAGPAAAIACTQRAAHSFVEELDRMAEVLVGT